VHAEAPASKYSPPAQAATRVEVAVAVAVPEAEGVELPVVEAVAEAEPVLVLEEERLVVGDVVGLALAEAVVVLEAVAEAEAVLVRDGVGLGDEVVVEVARAEFEADGAALETHWALYVPLPCGCA